MRLNRADEARARLRDLGEHRFLVLRIALHRVHEIRNQIGATLQLNFDLTLRRVGLLVERLNAVVSARAQRKQQAEVRASVSWCELLDEIGWTVRH